MKRNLLLFGVFVLLLIATYFFQEKKVEKAFTDSQTEGRLLQEGITQLKLPHVEAEKKKESWFAGKVLLSHNTFKQIEKKLSEIKKVKDIEGEWSAYFPNPFSFEVNHIKWTIGDLSLDKQGFYIALDKKIYLAEIDGESTQLTNDEHDIAAIKLNELVSFLSKPVTELKENQLFRFYPDLPLEQVTVAVDGSLPFELDLVQDVTHPAPINGISVHRELQGKFFSLLTQVTIKEEVPYSEKLKFKKLGEIRFKNSKEEINWELWIKDAKSADSFIVDSKTKRAFSMVGGTLRVFFIQLQDYWDKKVIPLSAFKNFTRLNTEFIQGSKHAKVIVLNREPLAFEVSGYKVDQLKMEQLFQIIFNLGPKDQGSRVSNLSKSEKQQLLSEEHLRLEVMGQELILWRKQEEVIVANLTQGFKVHFTLIDENFRGTFEDVLK